MMWIRIGALAQCFPYPGKRRHPAEEGCVCSQGKTKQWLCLGTAASAQRGSARWRFSHTGGKKDRETQRKREWGEQGTARTLPGGSFFLPAIINGILPLTHSSARQTKDPTFQWSLTSKPASQPQLSHIFLTHRSKVSWWQWVELWVSVWEDLCFWKKIIDLT